MRRGPARTMPSMKTKIFVDTSAFVALYNKNDQHHAAAAQYLGGLDHSAVALHTTNYIFDETLTRIRSQDGFQAARRFAEGFRRSTLFVYHYVDRDTETQALSIFEKFADKLLSFTDCTSFAVMRAHKIAQAFTFDDDFSKVGFEIANPL